MDKQTGKSASGTYAGETVTGLADVLLRAASVMIIGLDLRGNVTIFNAAAENATGFSSAEVVGRSLFEIMSSGRADVGLWNAFRLLPVDSPDPARFDCEGAMRTRDGEERHIAWRFSAAPRHDGDTRVLVFGTDITGLRHFEQKSRELSRKVILMQEEERAALSRELHDELGQQLTAMRMEIEFLRKRGGGGGDSAEYLSMVAGMVENASVELRRICRGLRPQILDDLGLAAAMEALVEDASRMTGGGISFSCEPFENSEIPPETAICIYRVLQEALNNVAKHSGAGAGSVAFGQRRGWFVLEVADSGSGFEPGGVPKGRYGIIGMNERAEMCGGALEVESSPGRGTTVRMKIPRVAAEGENI